MLALQAAKFAFRIRVRSGAIVDHLTIAGSDEPDAERKLRQIYHGCVILDVRELGCQMQRCGELTYEDVVDLISSGHAAAARPTSP